MKRDRYLVCYDIRESKRLRNVARTMEAFGVRLQYSVIVCDLSLRELVDLKSALREILKSVDSVMLVPLGAGYDTSCFEFMGNIPDLPTGGSVIV